MPDNGRDNGYSTVTGLVYVFNLIVGTGALALPGAVAKAGFLSGILLITILGFVSYITVTFIAETLAVANAVGTLHIQYDNDNDDDDGDSEETTPLTEPEPEFFEIKEKFELSELAASLLPRPARLVVVSTLILYLFGDLSIYCAVIALSLVHSSCTTPTNISCNATIPDDLPCWSASSVSRQDMYHIFVFSFVLTLSPFVFMNLQKTKWMQVITTVFRWAAFIVMIGWSWERLQNYGSQGSPPVANIYALPTMFGACVYSFMCQHSIPGLVQPVLNKPLFLKVLPFDYGIIAFFYLLLSMTAVFTFSDVADLYTLNFWRFNCDSESSTIYFLNYFLALFPVFTLSTSFPIIAITLRSNLKELVGDGWTAKILTPVSTLIVPAALAAAVPNIQLLVGFVGSYAGAALQYITPALLVSSARSRAQCLRNNPYKSPFQSKHWISAVYVWAGICLTLISINYIMIFV